MTNQHSLTDLQKNVALWNTRRIKHPEIYPDLSGVNLSNMGLSPFLDDL